MIHHVKRRSGLGRLESVQHKLKITVQAKSVSDASWYQFRMFLEYFGKVFGRITIAVNPAYQAKNVVVVGRSLRRACPPDRINVSAVVRGTEIITPQLTSSHRGIGTVGHTETLLQG